jgi:excinuclease ABC subunit C
MVSTSAHFDSKRFLQSLTHAPGVYRMLGRTGDILYVGKAGDLRKRVGSYFSKTTSDPKTRALLANVAGIEVTVTHTETEALLLENNLIKRHRPRYNVVLRDDKSYPYIRLTGDRAFPRLMFYRGRRREQDRFFGPYPSAAGARETLNLLQKMFRLRQCNESFFRNRSRPCLQYQIKRCSAPCVGLIDSEQYRHDVDSAVLFLEGKSATVIDQLVKRMEEASAHLDFEQAARYRDQVAKLRQTQEHQSVSGPSGDFDVIGAESRADVNCVAVIFIRNGRTLGSQTFFPKAGGATTATDVLAAFLPQYYLGKEVPAEILINLPFDDAELVQTALTEQAGKRVRIRQRVRGERLRWLRMASVNASQALATRLAMDTDMRYRFEALAEVFDLDQLPARMECFDISHTGGESPVASCVVFDESGPRKSDYRRFNIENIAPGDDYGAMRQALSRRYTRLKRGEAALPDVLLVDGGRGQLRQAAEVLEELQVEGVTLGAVAKGVSRRPGLEQIFRAEKGAPIILPPDSPALHLIQQIRDEAHRFAITGHRRRRARTRTTSTLEEIAGLGPKRRQQLLKQFGGLRGVTRAGVDDLVAVHGISRALAERIYDSFHVSQ